MLLQQEEPLEELDLFPDADSDDALARRRELKAIHNLIFHEESLREPAEILVRCSTSPTINPIIALEEDLSKHKAEIINLKRALSRQIDDFTKERDRIVKSHKDEIRTLKSEIESLTQELVEKKEENGKLKAALQAAESTPNVS